MRRLCLVISFALMAVLCFAAFSWAMDTVIYDATDKYIVDSTERVILKVYTQETTLGSGDYSAFLEVRNSVGTFELRTDYDQTKIVVTDISGSTPTQLSGILGSSVYTLHDGTVTPLTSPNIGASFDQDTGTLSVLCTTNGMPGFHAMKLTIQNNALVTCGTANGKTYSYGSGSYGSDTQCVGGTPDNSAFPAAGNTVTWRCSGNGATSGTCSASQLAAPGACGTADGRTYPYGSSSYGSYSQCAPGTSSNTAFPTAGNSVSWTCTSGGVTSGACSASQSATTPGQCGTANKTYSYGSTGYGADTFCAPGTSNPSNPSFPTAGNTVTWTCTNDGISSGTCSASQTAAPGACGTASKTYAFGSTSYGTDTFCAPGTPNPSSPAFPAAGATVNWTCTNGGVTSNCSASQSTTPPAKPDLVVTYSSVGGFGTNGVSFNANVTIANIGNAAAGPFTVKLYISPAKTLSNATLLTNGTQTVTGLAAGQSLTLTFRSLKFNSLPLHTPMYAIAVVDADNQVGENNENTSCPSVGTPSNYPGQSNFYCADYEVL